LRPATSGEPGKTYVDVRLKPSRSEPEQCECSSGYDLN
jgi:hypothetical protein